MKKWIRSLLAFLILLGAGETAFAEEKELEGTVTLSGAWAIYPTVVAWAQGFQKNHPKVKVDVSAGGAGKGAADAIAGLVDIGMVSRDPDPVEIKQGVIPVYVLHDAVFPVVSDKNPAWTALSKKGIKRQSWIDIYISGIITNWDEIAGRSVNKKIHVYTRSDSCGAAASWAQYAGNKKQEDLKGIGIYGDPGLLEAVKRDPIGVGYNNFSFVFTREGNIVQGIKVVPIDSNENGIADPNEVFTNRFEAVEAIKKRGYPATRKNFFFLKKDPSPVAKAFVRFALSEEGTKIADEVGTGLPIPQEDRQDALRKLE